jgi:hypothetical protein
VPQSLLEAIKSGQWDYEPQERSVEETHPTDALPGSLEKLAVMSERLRLGLPLWHPEDRVCYGDETEA